MAEKLLVQLEDSVGNIYYLHTSADVVFCEDGISVQTKLAQKIEKADIIQNATTASTTKVVSASVAKNLQDQINEQNTKLIYGFNDAVTKATSAQIYDYSNIYIQGKIAIINLSVNIGRTSDLTQWNETIIGTISTLKPKYQCVSVVSCQSTGLCADIVLNTDGTIKLGTRNFTLPKDEFIRGQIVYVLN